MKTERNMASSNRAADRNISSTLLNCMYAIIDLNDRYQGLLEYMIVVCIYAQEEQVGVCTRM